MVFSVWCDCYFYDDADDYGHHHRHDRRCQVFFHATATLQILTYTGCDQRRCNKQLRKICMRNVPGHVSMNPKACALGSSGLENAGRSISSRSMLFGACSEQHAPRAYAPNNMLFGACYSKILCSWSIMLCSESIA